LFPETDTVLESLLSRPRVLVGSCVAVAAAALAAHPSLARTIGVDVWNVPALKEQVRDAAVVEDRLADEDDEVMRRIAVKEAIIADLIAERVTLSAATARFVEMNSTRPHYLAALRDSYPGATDGEKYARNVISFAVARVNPADRAALSSRLEGELRQALAAAATH
jgi:hypothetical protein